MDKQRQGQPIAGSWTWTLASGLVALLLGVVAFFLPLVDWTPKGGLVGWLLFVAGMSELAFGWKRGLDEVAKVAIGSGALTGLAGLLFVVNPLAGYFPVAHVVVAWLFLRAAWLFYMGLQSSSDRLGPWLVLRAATDFLLCLVLLVGLQISALVVSLFGPTGEVVATFSLILAASFLMSGASQSAIALVPRRRSSTAD
jgi:uncharacterized membrane protein HdeD (DUF308 family)